MGSNNTGGELIAALLIGLVLVVVFVGLLFTLGWNFGAVALLGAVGVQATGLTIFEGMGVVLVLSVVSMLFKGKAEIRG